MYHERWGCVDQGQGCVGGGWDMGEGCQQWWQHVQGGSDPSLWLGMHESGHGKRVRESGRESGIRGGSSKFLCSHWAPRWALSRHSSATQVPSWLARLWLEDFQGFKSSRAELSHSNTT